MKSSDTFWSQRPAGHSMDTLQHYQHLQGHVFLINSETFGQACSCGFIFTVSLLCIFQYATAAVLVFAVSFFFYDCNDVSCRPTTVVLEVVLLSGDCVDIYSTSDQFV